ETLVALAENIRGAGVEGDRGEVGEWNIGVAGRGLHADLEIAHGIEVAAIFGGEANRHVELAVGLQQRRGDGAAERRLHDAVDVADREAVARRGRAIDPDVEVRLPEHPKLAEVRYSLHLRELTLGLVRESFQHGKIGPDDLDRVRAFHPGQTLLDVVLDVLREVEID